MKRAEEVYKYCRAFHEREDGLLLDPALFRDRGFCEFCDERFGQLKGVDSL